MKTYDKYKSSGIDWIGDIPEHWEVRKLRFVGNFTASGIDKKIIEGEPIVKIINYTDVYGNSNNILNSARTYMEVSCSEERQKEHQVKKGDLIFTPSSETIEDIGVSALVNEDLENTAYSYHVLRFRFEKELAHNFKKYLCSNHFVLNQFSSNAKGTTRQILNRDNFNSINVLLPTFPEQSAIADYLDEKTAQIDKLIAEKRRLIELLKEERLGVINQAVTRGINPHAKLKPSGIAWLGDIPEHWEVKKLKYVASFRSGEGITSDAIRDEGEFPVYGGNGLRGYFSSFTHDGNFALIGRQGALCGNVNYAFGKFWASEHAVVATLLDEHEVFWFGELLRIMNLNQYSQSAAQPGLAVENIKNLSAAVPSIEEQKQIVEFIETATGKTDATIATIEKEIGFLREYRTALISEVVTGKIKVIDN